MTALGLAAGAVLLTLWWTLKGRTCGHHDLSIDNERMNDGCA